MQRYWYQATNKEAVPSFTRQITEEAISFFQQSSNIGDPEGPYQFALYYLNRTGVKQDQEKAKEEFKTAADLGHINGAYEYAKICSQQSNEEEAKYFLIATKGNHTKVKL